MTGRSPVASPRWCPSTPRRFTPPRSGCRIWAQRRTPHRHPLASARHRRPPDRGCTRRSSTMAAVSGTTYPGRVTDRGLDAVQPPGRPGYGPSRPNTRIAVPPTGIIAGDIEETAIACVVIAATALIAGVAVAPPAHAGMGAKRHVHRDLERQWARSNDIFHKQNSVGPSGRSPRSAAIPPNAPVR